MMFRTFFLLTVVGGLGLYTQAGREPLAGWIARGEALIAQARGEATRQTATLTAMLPGSGGGSAAAAPAAAAGRPGAGVPAAVSGAPVAPGGLRKCVQQGKVLYTADACPAGSAELTVSGGVSVLPDSREAVASARAAMGAGTEAPKAAGAVGVGEDRKAAPKNALREKLLGPEDPDMRARAIDRAIGD